MKTQNQKSIYSTLIERILPSAITFLKEHLQVECKNFGPKMPKAPNRRVKKVLTADNKGSYPLKSLVKGMLKSSVIYAEILFLVAVSVFFCGRNDSANQKEVHQFNQNHLSNLEHTLGFLEEGF